MEAVLGWAKEVGQGLDELTDEQRKEILQMVVEQVVIDRNNNVDITLAIPVDDDFLEPNSPEPDFPETDSVALASKEPSSLLRRSSLVFCTRLTALLRHVVGFPDLGLLRGLCPVSGIGRRLAYPVAGEPNVVPKFT